MVGETTYAVNRLRGKLLHGRPEGIVILCILAVDI